MCHHLKTRVVLVTFLLLVSFHRVYAMLPFPPSFYRDLQQTHYAFPHEDGDSLSDVELRGYWWDHYLFADYCRTREDWLTWREDPVVQTLIPFFMRGKCILEHLDFQHCFPTTFPLRLQEKVAAALTDAFRDRFTEFKYGLDRAVTVTQILLYWRLQGSKEFDDLCRKWRNVVQTVGPNTVALSCLCRMPAYWRAVDDLAARYVPLCDFVARLAEVENIPAGSKNGFGEFDATHLEPVHTVQ